MYICICQAVTDTQIRAAAADGATSLSDLSRSLGVAAGCGSCACMAESVLRESSECAAGTARAGDARAVAA